MKSKTAISDRWQSFAVDMLTKFIEVNKEQAGKQDSSILFKIYKGQSIDKIADDEKLSGTRIRQLLEVASRKIEKIITSANVTELKSLTEVCKGLEKENNSLRRTLKIHAHEEVTPLSKLELSKRTLTVLDELDITSIEQLCTVEVEDIMKVRGAGKKTITEIETALRKLDLDLGSGE